MAERQVSVRLSVIDGGKVKAELKSVGDEGERALRRIGEATTPANAGLRVVNAVASDARGRLDDMTAKAGIAGVVNRRVGSQLVETLSIAHAAKQEFRPRRHGDFRLNALGQKGPKLGVVPAQVVSAGVAALPDRRS